MRRLAREVEVCLTALRQVFILVAVILIARPLAAQQYTFTHFTGGVGGRGSIDANGTRARFNTPFGIARASDGTLYVSDTVNGAIRVIEADGDVSTLVGFRSASSADGARNHVLLASPKHLAIGADGNIYVAVNSDHTIRRITPQGVVTTIAGAIGQTGSTDGGGATARFNAPSGLAFDGDGNLFVADSYNHAIRKITPAGIVSTYAGSAGFSGSADGTGAAARFNSPAAVATDSFGNVYVADTNNHTIRKITTGRVVTTLAGLAGTPGSANGSGASARFKQPSGLVADSSANIFVADSYNSLIRKVTPAGSVSTLAGSANDPGQVDGTGSAAKFWIPTGITIDPATSHLYVTDSYGCTIRRVTAAGVVTTIAGTATSATHADGAGATARHTFPSGIASDASGNLFVSDRYGSFTVRKITPAGSVTTFAGNEGVQGVVNATGSAAGFFDPAGLDVDASGNVYVAEPAAHVIRKITSVGVVTTFAGGTSISGTVNGTGASARFNGPSDVATDTAGNVFVCDSDNHAIRKITPAGVVTTFAGLAGTSGSTDATGTSARFNTPWGIAIDGSNNLYVTDNGNHTIRKITSAGLVTTLAGLAGSTGSADGTGGAARFSKPEGIDVDAAGNVYVGDRNGPLIRRITPAGVVTTIAGTFGRIASEDGTGPVAHFARPMAVAVNPDGILFIADHENHAIRRGAPAISDAATIDQAIAPVFATRQLNTSPNSATSWLWSIVRRPAGSTAALSSSYVANPTFTPDVPDTYTFQLEATSSSGKSITLVELEATCPAINVGPSSLPYGVSGDLYTQTISASGGTAPYTFSVTSGALPAGLTLTSGGDLSGILSAAGDYTFTVTASDAMGCQGERGYRIVVHALYPPTNLVATGSGTSVTVTWTAVGGAAGYHVYRKGVDGVWTLAGDTATTSFHESGLPADTVFLYTATAFDSAMNSSAEGARDLATTFVFTDPTIVAGSTKVKGVHIDELRAAVQAVQSIASPPMSLVANIAGPIAGLIRAVDVEALRAQLDDARSQLSLPALSYTNGSLAGVTVKAVHINELRNGVK